MSVDIPRALVRIEETAKQLNVLCDQAGESVKRLEGFLAQAHVGVHASVKIWDTSDEYGPGDSHGISYGKYGTSFRVYLYWDVPEDQQTTTKPWAECKREDKLASLPFLGKLLEKIAEVLSEKVTEAEQALAAIAAFTESRNANDSTTSPVATNKSGGKK